MAIPFFHVQGYTADDPLDKAPKLVRFGIVSAVNLVLSIGLLYLITDNKVVRFNGFSVWGIAFSPFATMVLEVIINCLVYAPIIVLLRKASSVYIYLVVLLPYFLLDLFIEHHYRAAGRPDLALWNYYDSSIVSSIHPPAFRFFCTLTVDALLFGVAALFLSRNVAKILYRNKDYPRQPTKRQYNAVFKK